MFFLANRAVTYTGGIFLFCITEWNSFRQSYTTEYSYVSYTIIILTESRLVMVPDQTITSTLAFYVIKYLLQSLPFLLCPATNQWNAPCLWTCPKLHNPTAPAVTDPFSWVIRYWRKHMNYAASSAATPSNDPHFCHTQQLSNTPKN